MEERSNYLIGYGERLASDLAAPVGGAPKKHPYSFAEARKRLAPKVKAAIKELATLPRELCPKDQAVALVTLHPTYLAKTYYPAELLKSYRLETVGSRSRADSGGFFLVHFSGDTQSRRSSTSLGHVRTLSNSPRILIACAKVHPP